MLHRKFSVAIHVQSQLKNLLQLSIFITEPKLPHQWNATLPCREEDGWRKCNLTHETYKDEFIKECTFLRPFLNAYCLSSYNRVLTNALPHYYMNIFMKECTTRRSTSSCLRWYNQSELHRKFPHYSNMTKELPLHTEICVPRNYDLKLYCNLTQHQDNNLCSDDELFVKVEAHSSHYGYYWPEWFK